MLAEHLVKVGKVQGSRGDGETCLRLIGCSSACGEGESASSQCAQVHCEGVVVQGNRETG